MEVLRIVIISFIFSIFGASYATERYKNKQIDIAFTACQYGYSVAVIDYNLTTIDLNKVTNACKDIKELK